MTVTTAAPYARLLIHEEDGTWWAESSDVAGYTAAAETYEECVRLAVDGVRQAFPDPESVTVVWWKG